MNSNIAFNNTINEDNINNKMFDIVLEETLMAHLLQNGKESEVLELNPIDFTKDECKKMLIASKELVKEGKKIDLVSLRDKDRSLNPAYTVDLIDYLILSLDVKQSIYLLRTLTNRRVMYLNAREVMKHCLSGEDADAEVAIENIKEGKNLNLGDELQPINEYIDGIVEKSFIEFDNPNHLPGLKTGFKQFDYLAGGLQGLVTIAARPSQGKTMLVTNMMEYIGANKNVLMFSLEMSKEDIISRIIKKNEKLSYGDYEQIWKDYNLKKISEKEFEQFKEEYKIDRVKAAAITEEKHLYIDDKAGVDVEYIRQKTIYNMKTLKGGIDMVIVDHIGKISGKQKTTREVIMHITKTLQILQRELDIPIVMLSQLNRSLEVRNDKMPILSDLKESGTIEEDSDQILFLYRPFSYDDKEDPTEAKLSLAKNRKGKTGKFKLRCQMDKLEFRRWTERSV